MVGHGEPVRLVADPLDQVEGLGGAGQKDCLAVAGTEEFLVLLGEANDRQASGANGNPEGFQCLDGGPELALSSVDDDKVRPDTPPLAVRRWRGIDIGLVAGTIVIEREETGFAGIFGQ